MKDTFVLKTTIKEFSTMKECFEQEKMLNCKTKSH